MQASYSIAQLTALDFSPPEIIELAARTGYDQAGVRLLPVAPGAVAYPLMDDARMLRETLARMNDTGVKVFDLELIRLDGQFDLQRYLPFFEVGAQLGAKAVLVAGDDPEQGRLIEHYARLCDAMQPFGLSADLEFMPWTAVNDLASALHIVEQADRANGGILVDALHFDRSDSRFEDLQRIPAQWLHYAQICDAQAGLNFSTEQMIHTARCERLLPGDGNIDVQGLFDALPADLPVSVEVVNFGREANTSVHDWAAECLTKSRPFVQA